MSLFHQHNWQEIERFYAPPIREAFTFDGSNQEINKILFGVTTIVQKCKICNEINKVEILGKKNE